MGHGRAKAGGTPAGTGGCWAGVFGDVKGWSCGMDGRFFAALRMTAGVGKRVGPGKDGSVIAAPVPWVPACAGKTVWWFRRLQVGLEGVGGSAVILSEGKNVPADGGHASTVASTSHATGFRAARDILYSTPRQTGYSNPVPTVARQVHREACHARRNPAPITPSAVSSKTCCPAARCVPRTPRRSPAKPACVPTS